MIILRILKPVFLLLFLILTSCSPKKEAEKKLIDLQGEWQFALDTANVGVQQQWYLRDLEETVQLPGTTDSNEKGFLNTDTTTSHLNRVYTYEGAAWYRKKINVPADFEGQHLSLFLERTKPTRIWIDSTLVGSSKLLQSPQQFDLSRELTPGEHSITVQVNNNRELTPYRETHIFSDDTQTNWNGIIGEMFIGARPKTHIKNLQVYPDVEKKKIDIKLELENGLKLSDVRIELLVKRTLDGETRQLPSKIIDTSLASTLQLEYMMGKETLLWDEYQQPLYELTAVISNGNIKDSRTAPFGMRNFEARGTQFAINGRTTFLRGKHDAAVFPISGHTPMDVESWERVFEIAKSYGINHYRFHSYTPPEAAFTAADRVGIYLQPELPFWGGLDSDSVTTMLRKEGLALLKAFGNHPSFVMFSHGNEIWSGHDRVEENIAALEAYDSRPLYTMGSNNNIGYVGPREVSDFFVASRTPYEKDSILTHTRLTHAFVDSRDGGILNTTTPSTEIDYSYPVSQIDIPIVTHEIGQYQIYPDYSEIDKYTGVLRARNLEVFRDRLKEAGMLDQDSIFQKASGAWAAICYKAEMEAAIRTEGLAGFQLLDLQDFPGQGTALVGILDAFMDSKEVISREEWLQSCNDVVLLLKFPKYVWTTEEDFKASLEVANYSNRSFEEALNWELQTESGELLRKGEISGRVLENGDISSVGEIELDLSDIEEAEKLMLHIMLPGTSYSNTYPIWVYPPIETPKPKDILIADKFSPEVTATLENGGKVLLFPSEEAVKDQSVGGLFPPNFWNYEMFKSISGNNDKPYSPGTLGLLTNPEHPLFSSFPTDFHTNWQWFSIIKAGNPFILNETKKDYRPVVQVVDNLQRNHKLGLIFEFRVGKGKLLVCMSPLPEIMDKPAARQLYHSMVEYMNSANFNPEYELSPEALNRFFKG